MNFLLDNIDMDHSLYVVPKIKELKLKGISLYDIAEHFAHQPHFVFLDSRLHENRLGKYSFIASNPFLIFKSKGNKIWIQKGNENEIHEQTVNNVFDELNKIMIKFRIPHGFGEEYSPFIGGGIGYFSYELGRQVEILPCTTKDVINIPECYICFYNWVIIYNHQTEKFYLSHFDPQCSGKITSSSELITEIESISPHLYDKKEISRGWKTIQEEKLFETFRCDFTPQEYMDAINRIKEYILAGDVYQADMTQRFEVDMNDIPPWELYKRLMKINPAPFASYLNFSGVTVVSSSPERFLITNDRYVETRPIKGTVKRGTTPEEDEKNKLFLFNDEKNRAELAMIVDLLRNDIGRVCKANTVRVREFPDLETYSSVHHLVSTITGELMEGKNIIDLLKATFPGGSITGAPKIRAMEILDELEPVERGIYTGSIGYLGFNNCSDLNIAIRTITVTDKVAHIQAGGGIVADSKDRDEYEETLLKAQKLFKAFIKDD